MPRILAALFVFAALALAGCAGFGLVMSDLETNKPSLAEVFQSEWLRELVSNRGEKVGGHSHTSEGNSIGNRQKWHKVNEVSVLAVSDARASELLEEAMRRAITLAQEHARQCGEPRIATEKGLLKSFEITYEDPGVTGTLRGEVEAQPEGAWGLRCTLTQHTR